ncbi:MAG: hypothetical protein GDA36_04230 [Rhodobacteraceae bacterium]|nr:hypothetical protein [Paracoccaceae bacterium]
MEQHDNYRKPNFDRAYRKMSVWRDAQSGVRSGWDTVPGALEQLDATVFPAAHPDFLTTSLVASGHRTVSA